MTEKQEHPAYGVIRVSRVSGGDRRLFGSKIKHSHWMSIEISTAAIERNLSQDWIYPRNTIASVEMSEAQWATFVSSPGVGGGVPCTIETMRDGQWMRVEPMPEPESEREAARQEFADKMKDVHATFERVQAMLGKAIDTPGPVKKSDLRTIHDLLYTLTNLKSSMRFAEEQFERAMEQSVEAAKADLDAHITMTAQRLGLDTVRRTGLLESKDDT